MPQNDSSQQHLTIVTCPETKLLHGARFVNSPTPSGSTRFILDNTTKEGFGTFRSAAMAINKLFPELKPIDISVLPEGTDEDLEQMVSALPPDALITHMTPYNKKHANKDGSNDVVEVRVYNSINAPMLEIKISPAQVKALAARGIIELESTSGSDPELYYEYDHYLVAKKPINVKPA